MVERWPRGKSGPSRPLLSTSPSGRPGSAPKPRGPRGVKTTRLLHQGLRAARGLADIEAANPLGRVRWTVPQDQWHRLKPKTRRKLLRAGNQVGKTWAGLAEVIWHCLGIHPHFEIRAPPIEVVVVCSTWKQSVAIMQKFWDLVPKDEVAPGQHFSRRTGFGKDNPTFLFKNGSIIFFTTDDAGPRSVQGRSPHLVLIDELCSEEMYRECDRRVTRTNGWILLTFTPVNNPAEWCRELVKAGAIEEVHARLTVANLTPVGSAVPLCLSDGTPMDEAWIEEQRRLVFTWAAPVVLDGEWEFRTTDQWFTAFYRAEHVNETVPLDEFDLCLGIDYGTKVGKQVAVLVGVQGKGADQRLWILDMERDKEGRSTLEQDADAVLRMLDRHGQTWSDLRFAYGDRAHMTGADRKQNIDLESRIRRRLGVRQLNPRIWTAKRGAGGRHGSVFEGSRFLHSLMIRPGSFNIHPRCASLIDDLEKWDGTDNDHKDAIDALRYALEGFIFGRRHRNQTIRLAA